MPNIQSAKKRIRVSEKKRVFNDRRRRTMRSIIKEVRNLALQNNKEEANAKLPLAYKAIDKSAKGGIIKSNTASRYKSRLNTLIKKIS